MSWIEPDISDITESYRSELDELTSSWDYAMATSGMGWATPQQRLILQRINDLRSLISEYEVMV